MLQQGGEAYEQEWGNACAQQIHKEDGVQSEGEDKDFFFIMMMIDQVILEHNHKLLPSPTITKNMECHKNRECEVTELVDDLQAWRVPHYCLLNVLFDMHDGEENMPMTTRDIENR